MKIAKADKEKTLANVGNTKKDEFETEVDFKNRMANRDNAINEINETYEEKRLLLKRKRTRNRILLIEQYEHELNRLLVTSRKSIINLTVSLMNYNSETEIFPVSINENDINFFRGVVKVDKTNARSFKNNIDKFQILSETQLDRNGNIGLVNVVIHDPDTGNKYPIANPKLSGSVIRLDNEYY